MITSTDIHKGKILIVDDMPANVLLLNRILTGAGFNCVSSTMDPREVCDLHRKNQYDLILLDLEMPHMGGFQVMEGLKEIEKDSYLPVLVITAQPEHKIAALKAGARDFVSKPFDIAEVLTRVNNMMEVRLLHLKTKNLYQEVVVERLALVTAKDEIIRHALHLEDLVEERTHALRERVIELEGFSYTASHDMRAPLRAMQCYAQFLVDDYSSKLDDQAKGYLHQIMRSSVRLDSLVRDVLSYAKVLHDNLPMEKVDLDLLVRDIVETYAHGHYFKSQIKIRGILPSVMGKQALLTQCISNLLSNGIKFVIQGDIPQLEVRAESPTPGIFRIWFKDNGVGIAPENQERVFKMFERIYPATEYEGTGIGLTIVRKAVERMGGKLGCESELGKGSSFWIELKAAQALGPEPVTVGAPIPAKPELVLI
jgi:signal transduction histidine kinase